MIWQLGFRNLFRNRRRSLTVIFTISSGIAALFLFHGFNTGTANQYREDMIRSRYGHGQISIVAYHETIYEKPWQHWIQEPQKVMDQLKAQSFIQHVFPRVEFFGLVSSGSKTVSARGQAIDGAEESKFFTNLNIEEGKNLSSEADGLLLGRGIARALGVKPGDSVSVLANTIHGSINGVDLVVTGIFHTGIKDFDDNYFRVPLDKGMSLIDTAAVETIAVGLKDLESWSLLESFVQKNFKELESISFAVLDKVYYQNTVDWLEAQFQFIQAIILCIVFLGILNTVSSTILERKQEIGNLRANGESTFDIMKLLLVEGSILGLLGSVMGVLLGYLLTATLLRNGIPMPPGPGQTRSFSTFIELSQDMAFRSLIFGTLAAALGTLAAAFRVLSLTISEALRGT